MPRTSSWKQNKRFRNNLADLFLAGGVSGLACPEGPAKEVAKRKCLAPAIQRQCAHSGQQHPQGLPSIIAVFAAPHDCAQSCALNKLAKNIYECSGLTDLAQRLYTENLAKHLGLK